ncbi:hypothetical protein CR203_19480 [Salipaludibacillus neizhouensis]|uniref:Uncharacterized protein n=1 Tax=Salipaludibacillus neizhouensis TaxID=885475 RepID=A0A3A9K7N3_9BACI|nr:CBO0543 family protein [Salipaludibacillus neizhouensis]RKL65663.1 hypothetical protein CR203_19480 [Salipaludibacillus neizhouensis]
MKKSKEVSFLRITTMVALFLLPFAIYKRSFKDWIIIYLVSCIGNTFADRTLVSKGYVKYKIRPKSKIFSVHLPFDLIQYPLALLYYNQWTLNSKITGIFLKLLVFVIPQIIIETIAEKKTDLITFKKGWKWYHSLLSMAMKFLLCRLIIASIRKLNTKNETILSDAQSQE